MEQKQTTLYEFSSNGYVCPVCGRTFNSIKSLNSHLTKSHPDYVPAIFPGEGVTAVEWKGGYVEVKIRMKKSLWHDIRLRAIENNTTTDKLVFECLSKLAAFGNEYQLWSLVKDFREDQANLKRHDDSKTSYIA